MHRSSSKMLTLLVVALLAISPVFANTYYVSKSGYPAGADTTLKAAVDKATLNAGLDTIEICDDSTYNEVMNIGNSTWTGSCGDYIIQNGQKEDGTWADPIMGQGSGQNLFKLYAALVDGGTPFTFTVRLNPADTTPGKRLKFRSVNNFYFCKEIQQFVGAPPEGYAANIVLEKLDIQSGSIYWKFFQVYCGGTLTATDCNFINRIAGANSWYNTFYGPRTFSYTNCNFEWVLDNSAGILFAWYESPTQPTKAVWDFNNCSFGPTVSGVLTNAVGKAAGCPIFVCGKNNVTNGYHYPEGTVNFTDCAFREDLGFSGGNPNPVELPADANNNRLGWVPMVTIPGGNSIWNFVRPTFTGRFGSALINGSSISFGDPYAVGNNCHLGQTVTITGTATNKADFTPGLTATDVSDNIIRMGRTGSVTLNYCKASLNNPNSRLIYLGDQGSAGLAVPNETPNYAFLFSDVNIALNSCEFLDGSGKMQLIPHYRNWYSYTNGSGVAVTGDYAYVGHENPIPADQKKLTVSATNCIFEAEDGRLLNTNFVDNGSNPDPVYFDGTTAEKTWVEKCYTNHGKAYDFNFTNCTMFSASDGTAETMVDGADGTNGEPVSDNLTANYSIFDSTFNPNAKPASNLALVGSKNIAFRYDAGSVTSGFPAGVATGTAIAKPNLSATGRLTADSYAAFGGASGTTVTTDIDNDARPLPAATTADIGADEYNATSPTYTAFSISGARGAVGQFAEVTGYITDKFGFAGDAVSYMVEQKNHAGIRVVNWCSNDYAVGQKVTFKGIVKQPDANPGAGLDGETILFATSSSIADAGIAVPDMYLMVGRTVAQSFLDNELSTEGVYAKVAGKVTYSAPATFGGVTYLCYWVDDGSGYVDGSGANDGTADVKGIRVLYYGTGTDYPAVGQTVSVTGNVGLLNFDKVGGGQVSVPVVWQKEWKVQ